MMNRLLAAALLGAAALAHAQQPASAPAPAPVSPAKKALVDRILQLQQPSLEVVARSLVERPAVQMMQEAGAILQRQVAPEKREAMAKQIEAEVKKYVDESTALVRERAIKLAPVTIGPVLEQRFSEEELKQLVAWFESPVAKKYETAGREMQTALVQKLLPDAAPAVDPKIRALQSRVGAILGVPPTQPLPASGAGGDAMSTTRPGAAKPPATRASGK